jgi:outer membrane protein
VKKQIDLRNPKSNLVVLSVALLSLIVASASFALHFTSKNKIVYVDALKLISNYKGMEVARNGLNAKSAVWKKNLDTLKSEFDHTVSDFEKNKKSASARENKLAEELIASKQNQYLNYEQTVKEAYQKEDKELSEEILKTINNYIKRYGEKEGYTIILSATHYGNIAYADNALDITDIILKGLNEEYKLAK